MKKLNILIIAILLPVFAIVAQTPYWQWAKAPTGVGYGIGPGTSAIASDHHGHIYVCGSYDSTSVFGSTVLTGLGSFLAKYDTLGNVIWAKSAQSPIGAGALGVTADNNGNVYIVGSYQSTITVGTFVLNNNVAGGAYNESVFVAKYDSLGNVLWAKTSGATTINNNTFDNFGTDVGVDGSGNVYITGLYESYSILFGSITLQNPTQDGQLYFLTKYDAAGNEVWAQQADLGTNPGFGSYAWAYSLAVDQPGNIYLTGAGNDSVIFGNTRLYGYNTAFLAKFNTNGTPQWAVGQSLNPGFLGITYAFPMAITLDPSNNIFITGYFLDSGVIFGHDTLRPLQTSQSTFTAKFDAGGNPLWIRGAATGNNGGGGGLYADAQGNAYVIGAFTPPSVAFGPDTLQNGSRSNIFVVKYDAGGNVIWAIDAGGTSEAYGASVTGDATGGLYFAGGFDSSATCTFGQNSVGDGGVGDMFLAKIGICNNPAAPVNTTVTAAQSVCHGSSTTLTTSGTGTLSWYTTATGGNSIATGGSFTTPPLTATDTFYAQAYTCGPSARTAVIVTVNPKPSPTISLQGTDTLTTAGFSAYQWLTNNAAINGATNQNYVPLVNGYYQVAVTNSNGCADTSAQYYFTGICTAPAAPVNTTTTNQQHVCIGGNTTLSASGSGTLTWYSTDTAGLSLQTGDNYTTPNLLATTTYYVQDNTCTSSVRTAITVTVFSVPVPTITNAGNNTLTTDSFANYQWLFNGNAINGATQRVYLADTTGNYEVAVTDSNGCYGSSSQFYLNITGITIIGMQPSIYIYPNPSNGVVFVNGAPANSTIQLYNTLGELVYSGPVNYSGPVTMPGIATGIYLYKILQNAAVLQLGKLVMGQQN